MYLCGEIGRGRAKGLPNCIVSKSRQDALFDGSELKAANTPLHSEHLVQLEDYVRHVREWLKAKGSDYAQGFEVEGYLIGSHADTAAGKNEKVKRLQAKLADDTLAPGIRVLDLLTLLGRTKMAHKELLDAQKKALEEPDKG